MADNVGINTGSGATVAADEIGGVKFQRIKLIHGADGVNAGDVSTANPLPVSDAGGSLTVDSTQFPASLGQKAAAASFAVTLDALQDEYLMNSSAALTTIDESTADLSANFGTTTDVAATTDGQQSAMSRLRGLIKWAYERMPASLGQKAMSASLPVVIASDQSAIPVSTSTNTSKLNLNRISGATFAASSTGAYTNGDTVGTKVTLTSAVGASNFGELIQFVIKILNYTTLADLDVFIFDADPTTSTFTDNNAIEITAADNTKIIFSFKVSSSDFDLAAGGGTGTNTAIATKTFDHQNMLRAASGTTLYLAVVARGGLDMIAGDTISLDVCTRTL